MTERHKKKIKWTTRIAFSSLGILTFILLVNEYREPLLGTQKGYASQNFGFNLFFFLPLLLVAIGLGFAAIGRTIKYWRSWIELNEKIKIIGMSLPSIAVWTYIIIRFFV